MNTTKSPTEQDAHIGQMIAERRRYLGISQSNLGEAVGVSFQQIQKYEKGSNRIAAGRLAAIADALQMPLTDLYHPGEVNYSVEALKLAERFDRLSPEHRKTIIQLLNTLGSTRPV